MIIILIGWISRLFRVLDRQSANGKIEFIGSDSVGDGRKRHGIERQVGLPGHTQTGGHTLRKQSHDHFE